ncbi:MAG: phenylalanine--tRNA ligase subunit beta [Bacteroidota bacterium]|nr:phenylalanine--tRNA ligase subunit beta [Bacteroidota bacterium]
MKISLNWLNQFLNLDIPAQDVACILTDIGLEVEKIELVESIKGGLKGVVIGEVLTKNTHPNADRLNITTVDIGNEEPLQIVCGAPNVDTGQKVPVATVGTWLYDGDNKFKIKKSKIRGEVSEGMICGEDELGLGEATDGIMVLDAKIKAGILAADYFKLESDTVFDIGLTPNRTDAMSHMGVARELMCVLNYRGSKLKMCMPKVDTFNIDNKTCPIEVRIDNKELCNRYAGVAISNVVVGDSPDWLKKHLISIGLTPKNNIVDITNFVLHEIGQPLHAFDMKNIKGDKIIVKKAKKGSKFKTLDGETRVLHTDDLMISNTEGDMCIAGVLGGLESSVTESTNSVFIESACFNPISIRKTAKRHIIHSDASFRFERGVDINMVIYALKRASLLIQEIAGGTISGITDVFPEPIESILLNFRYSKMNSLIGEEIDPIIIKKILKNLDIKIVKELEDDSLSLSIPSFRQDVTREVDVIEEILRIYGYNTIGIQDQFLISNNSSESNNARLIVNSISSLLNNIGFHEVINNSLHTLKYNSLVPDIDNEFNVKMLNPLSQELSMMRRTMIFGGLNNLKFNHQRKVFNLKFYEFGKTYHKGNNGYIEKNHLMLFLSGNQEEENWNVNSKEIDLYYLKKVVNHILGRLGIKNISHNTTNSSSISEGLVYSIKKKNIVTLGKLEKNLLKYFKIKSKDVFIADFDWDHILNLTRYNNSVYKEFSKFPFVRRDLSLLLDENVKFSELENLAYKTEKSMLKEVSLFDVYEGKELPKGKKSYAISFILSDNKETLTEDSIDKIMSNILKSFKDKLAAEIRS